MVTTSPPFEIQELIGPLGSAQKWRVDWLGNVHKPRTHHAQYMISVFFSPLYQGYEGPVTDPDAADSARQVEIELGVGYLPALHIGAVFYQGRKVNPLRPSMKVTLEISPGHFQFMWMNDNIERLASKRDMVVTSREFKIGLAAYAQAKNSLNLFVQDASQTDPFFVAIPSIEVARFFFCSSSLLSRHLFSSGWEDLIYEKQCNTENFPDEVVVGLRQVTGLDRGYARHLAYFLVDPLTRDGVRGVHQTLQETGNGRPQSPIECRIPIDEPVKIEAEVIQTTVNGGRGSRFFVTRLLRVHRTIPFKSCYAWPEIHPGQGDNWDDPDLKPMHLPKAKKDPSPPTEPSFKAPIIGNPEELATDPTVGDDFGRPTKFSKLLDIPLDEDRFPGLADMPTPLAPKDKQKYRNLGKDQIRRPIDGKQVSTGEPGGSRPVAPVNLNVDPFRIEDEGLRMLVEAIPWLERLGYKTSQLPVVFLNRFTARENRKNLWTRIPIAASATQRSSYRSKQLLALLITSPRGACLIGEIEPDPPKAGRLQEEVRRHFVAGFHLHHPSEAEDELQLIAREVAHRNGWPEYDAKARKFRINKKVISGERARHLNITTAQELAQRIYGSILANLNI